MVRDFLQRLARPPVFADEHKTQNARAIYIIVWSLMTAITFFEGILLIISPEQKARWISLTVATIGLGVMVLALTKNGSVRFAGMVLLGSIWLIATLNAYTGNGIRTPSTIVFFHLTLIAGLLYGYRGSLIAAAFCLLTGLGLVIAEQRGMIATEAIFHTPLTYWISYSLMMVLLLGIFYLAISSIQAAATRRQQESSARERVEGELRDREMRYQALFEDSPIILFEENYSAIKRYLDHLQADGIQDYASYFEKNPDAVQQCANMVQIVDVNKAALVWYNFTDINQMRGAILGPLLGPEGRAEFIRELLDLIQNKTHFETFSTRRSLDGETIHLIIRGTVPPGYEDTWGRVLVSILDVTELKRTEEALKESQMQLAGIIESAMDAIITVDAEQRIMLFNSAAEQIFQYSAQEMIGQPLELIIPKRFRARHQELVRKYEGRTRRVDRPETLYGLKADGTEFPIEASISQLRLNGQVLNTILLSDITQRRQAEEALRELNEQLERRVEERTAQLEESNKDLEAFSYSISHDLRAPLRGIDGFSRILRDEYAEVLPDDGRELIERIRAGTARMTQLIDDLLRFSRLGRQPLNLQTLQTAEIVQNALETLKDERNMRKVEISVWSLPPCEGDSSLLLQVWINLLSNAMKYTRKREVGRIEIGCLQGEDSQKIFYVRDNGTGFDMQYADRLYGVFQRLHSESEFEGTGVGLAIAHRIILRHGGRIWAESELDKGSTFYFTIP